MKRTIEGCKCGAYINTQHKKHIKEWRDNHWLCHREETGPEGTTSVAEISLQYDFDNLSGMRPPIGFTKNPTERAL